MDLKKTEPEEIGTTNRKYILSGIIFGVLLTLIIILILDFQDIMSAFRTFQLTYLPLIFVLAPMNYLLRYIKWNYYLKLSGLKPNPRVNMLIFLSGLSMTVTPAKVGELLKCYLLKKHIQAPVSTTSSIVLAERVTDAASMVILASIGSMTYRYGGYILGITALGILFIPAFFHFEGLLKPLQRIQAVLFKKRHLDFWQSFRQNAKNLFEFKSFAYAVGLGIISWGLEGFIVFLVVKALGSEMALLPSIFVVSFSSIAGALSFIPGGLLVAEGSILALLVLFGIDKEVAAATMIVTRLSTLWLGVGLGAVGLYFVRKKLYS